MKALKKILFLGLIVIATASFNNVIAQTFNNENIQAQSAIGPRYKLILDLLKEEVKTNKAFYQYAQKINEDIEQTLEFGEGNDDCSDYVPLLMEGLKQNAKLAEYYYVQGVYGYKFDISENNKILSVTYNFQSVFDENGTFTKELYNIDIVGDNTQQKLESAQAENYIKNNFCVPLNQILDQNRNLSIPQLLNVLKNRFSR